MTTPIASLAESKILVLKVVHGQECFPLSYAPTPSPCAQKFADQAVFTAIFSLGVSKDCKDLI